MRGASGIGEGDFGLADGARRFENWEFPYALVLGMGEAARYALEVGIEEGGSRAVGLAAHVRERLGALPGVRLADRGRRLCAIVTAEVKGWDTTEGTTALVHRLRDIGINTSVASSEDGSPVSVVRISPHYYNTTEEVAELVNAIQVLLREIGQ